MAPLRRCHNSSLSAFARVCFLPVDLSWAYIRMLVSTKYLPLMDLVTRSRRRPPEVEALAQARQRSAAGLVEGLPLANKGFEPVGQERADRASLVSGQHAGLSKEAGVELQRDICLHAGF